MQRLLSLLCLLALAGCWGNNPKLANLIGRDRSWFPLQLGANSTNLIALTNAVVQEIGHLEGVSLQVVDIDWIELMDNLDKSQVGAVFSAINPTLMAQEKYSFSDPVIYLGPVLVVPMNSGVQSLADLECKKVGVYQYNDSVSLAQNYPSLMISLYQNMPEVLETLNRGQLDAVLMPSLDAHSLVDNLHSCDLKIVTPPLNQKALRLITLKNQNPTLIRHFNHGLKKMRDNNSYQKFLKEFNLY